MWAKRGLERGGVLAALLLLGLVLAVGCGPTVSPESADAFLRATNLGAAQLENKNTTEAVAAFETALALAPESPLALRNLARAHLAARNAAALAPLLEKARRLQPDSAATEYLSGLALVRESEYEAAIPHLEAAVRLAPGTAALRFQLANAYQMAGRDEEAAVQMQEVVRLDPLHSAAHYRLAGHARRGGDDEALALHLRELARLRTLLGEEDRSPDALERCRFTEAELPAALAAPAPQPPAVRFTAAPPLPEPLRSARGAALLELDARGRYTLFAIGGDGRGALWQTGTADAPGFESTVSDIALPESLSSAQPLVVAVGNFHDEIAPGEVYDAELHARNDVLVLSPAGAALLERDRDGGFVDVTGKAGLDALSGRAARWLDFDHDGDLDLAVGSETGLALWQNEGDGRFASVGDAVGIESIPAVRALLAVDLEADGAIDLLAVRDPEPSLVFEGRRTGRFERRPVPPGPAPSARQALIDDFTNDGRPDAVFVSPERLTLRPGAGGDAVHLGLAGLTPTAAVAVDYDNDGWLDLALAGRPAEPAGSTLRLWRNEGAAGWRDVASAVGLDTAGEHREVRGLIAADLDADGDADLLLAAEDGLRWLRNDGGNTHGQVKLRLQGTKSNPTALGAHVEARAAGLRASRAVQGVGVEIGVGDRRRIDALQTIWTNGVVDNQIDVAIGDAPITIVEQNVAAGSCPFLYAWDGEGYRFVTDLLGNAPIGLSLRRDVPLPADPDEYVYVGGDAALPAEAGFHRLVVSDELREVIYLDYARLVAVDHPADVEIHSTDRLMPDPFPPSELWPLGRRRAPVRALGDDGIDRTRAVARIDGEFAPPGALRPPPLRGQTQELVLTLDLPGLTDYARPVLALTGWLQYGDASTNIAMSQNRSLPVVPTTLEMELSSGAWRKVDVVVGMPAGKTKTILVDLTDELAPGVERLRLRTTFELRWDRIALFERLADEVMQLHAIEPSEARLSWRGYSEIRSRAPGHPTTPEYDALLASAPWRTTPEGWVTRLGDVLRLMAMRDEELVVMNGGDALELRFPALEAAPAPGLRRSYFFYSVGWDKDEDHNVIAGTTVEPLPVSGGAAQSEPVGDRTRFVPRDAPLRGRSGS